MFCIEFAVLDLNTRLDRLEAVQAILELKGRYGRLADEKYASNHQRLEPAEWARVANMQAACFTEDGEMDGGTEFGGPLRGRAQLEEWFTRSPWRFALHYYTPEYIRPIDAATAHGRWRLWQLGIPMQAGTPVLLAGSTQDSYRRTPQGWLIQCMRFDEIHIVDLGNLPAGIRCAVERTSKAELTE